MSVNGFNSAGENLVHWESSEIHRNQGHSGEWEKCLLTPCYEARAALGLVGCGRMIGPYPCCSVVCGDCLELMKQLPDGCVDAVITDPPYGILLSCDASWGHRERRGTWDYRISNIEEIISKARVSAIWGGNYYPLPISRGWLCWHKPDAPPSMSAFELAWTNCDNSARLISHSIAATNAERIGHPTQKPLAVMVWTVEQSAPLAETILDPFCGSGTTLVAAKKLGRHFLGFEISDDYCRIARERIALVEAQPTLFEKKPEQMTLGGDE